MSDVLSSLGVLALFLGMGCQIWLILLIMRGSPFLALVAVFVPFFAWYFAFTNWDIAKRPTLGILAGLAFWLLFMCAASHPSFQRTATVMRVGIVSNE
jgi:hypothetical protein